MSVPCLTKTLSYPRILLPYGFAEYTAISGPTNAQLSEIHVRVTIRPTRVYYS